jgi:hypothetical protein
VCVSVLCCVYVVLYRYHTNKQVSGGRDDGTSTVRGADRNREKDESLE